MIACREIILGLLLSASCSESSSVTADAGAGDDVASVDGPAATCSLAFMCSDASCTNVPPPPPLVVEAPFVRDDGKQWVAYFSTPVAGDTFAGSAAYSEVGNGPVLDVGWITMRVERDNVEQVQVIVPGVAAGQPIYVSWRNVGEREGVSFTRIQATCAARPS